MCILMQESSQTHVPGIGWRWGIGRVGLSVALGSGSRVACRRGFQGGLSTLELVFARGETGAGSCEPGRSGTCCEWFLDGGCAGGTYRALARDGVRPRVVASVSSRRAERTGMGYSKDFLGLQIANMSYMSVEF